MIDLYTTSILQHKAATFSGVEYGRASATIGNLVFKVKKLGAKHNGVTIAIVNLGGNAYLIQTNVFDPIRVTGVTNATEFAAKINSSDYRHFFCFVHVNVAGPVPTGSAVLAGGVDYTNFRNLRFTYESIADGGLFIFDNHAENLVVSQIEGNFNTVPTLTEVFVNIISLDNGLTPIPDEDAIFYCTKLDSTHKSFVITDCKIQLAPFRAIKVVFPQAGSIRITFRRESTIPNNN